jgi:hypothetical protein
MYNVSPALAADWHALLTDVLKHVDPTAQIVEPNDLDAFWRQPGLLISQTCGYPYVLGLHEHVQLIATPHFDAPGCEGATYSSVLVTRSSPARQSNSAAVKGPACLARICPGFRQSAVHRVRRRVASSPGKTCRCVATRREASNSGPSCG